MKSTSILSAISLSLVLSACGESAAPPPSTPANVESAPASNDADANDKATDDPQKSDINISDKIKQACGLSDSEARFAYNSAKIHPKDQTIMKKLADCFTTGPLKGQKMNLVGHADPRGEPEYNIVLGGKRADNVSSALTKAGLPAAQVTTTSRGEMDAVGTDEASWSKDRRVDILLAE